MSDVRVACAGSNGPPGEIVDQGTRERWHAGGMVGEYPRARCPQCGRVCVVYENTEGRSRHGHDQARLGAHVPDPVNAESSRARYAALVALRARHLDEYEQLLAAELEADAHPTVTLDQ